MVESYGTSRAANRLLVGGVPAPQDVVGTSCRDGVVDELLQFGLKIDELHAVPRECGVRIGVDTADFEFDGLGAVTVNLMLGTATGQGNDSLSGIENVIGTDFAADE